jgi:hypothetical protein
MQLDALQWHSEAAKRQISLQLQYHAVSYLPAQRLNSCCIPSSMCVAAPCACAAVWTAGYLLSSQAWRRQRERSVTLIQRLQALHLLGFGAG